MVKQMKQSEIENIVSNAKTSSHIAIDVVARTATSVLEEAFKSESYDQDEALHKLVKEVKDLLFCYKLTEAQAYRLTMLLLWTLGM